jgi:hypothetical protein
LNSDTGKFLRRMYADALRVMPGNNDELIRLATPVEPSGVAEKIDAARAERDRAASAGAPAVKQENHIHVNGAGRDVDDALRDAKDFMKRMNADLVRNFSGATQ